MGSFVRALTEAEKSLAREAFGAAHLDFTPLNVAELLQSLKVPEAAALCTAEDAQPSQYLRLWPHRHGSDGFFAAVWQRQ